MVPRIGWPRCRDRTPPAPSRTRSSSPWRYPRRRGCCAPAAAREAPDRAGIYGAPRQVNHPVRPPLTDNADAGARGSHRRPQALDAIPEFTDTGTCPASGDEGPARSGARGSRLAARSRGRRPPRRGCGVACAAAGKSLSGARHRRLLHMERCGDSGAHRAGPGHHGAGRPVLFGFADRLPGNPGRDPSFARASHHRCAGHRVRPGGAGGPGTAARLPPLPGA